MSVPLSLRKIVGSASIEKKAGATRLEAIRNKPKIELEIEAKFREKLSQDPLAQVSKEIELGATHGETPDGTTQEVFSKTELIEQALKKAGFKQDSIDALFHYDLMKKQGLDPDKPDQKLKSRVKAALKQSKPYQDWIERRQRAELPKPSTLNGWQSKMKRLADWFGSEYLSELTKDQAVSFKEYLFHEGIGHSTIKTYLGCLSGFWNWAKRNNQVQENIWEGLKVGLKDTNKKKAIPTQLMTKAKKRADHFQDIQFWIQYFTGCRKGEHAGLRWKDIDLMAGVIRFEEWEQGKWKRYLKCGEKDERTIPIHSKLMTKFLHHLPEAAENNSDEPIWGSDYKPSTASWGSNWAKNFKDVRYQFGSHELRGYVVTQLINLNVSPYMLFEITRHSMGGRSEVVSAYTRPKMGNVREAIERLE